MLIVTRCAIAPPKKFGRHEVARAKGSPSVPQVFHDERMRIIRGGVRQAEHIYKHAKCKRENYDPKKIFRPRLLILGHKSTPSRKSRFRVCHARVRSDPGTVPVSVRRRGIHYEMPGVSRSERPGTATVAMAESDTTTHAKENAKANQYWGGHNRKARANEKIFSARVVCFR